MRREAKLSFISLIIQHGQERHGIVVVVVLLFYVHGKHLRTCQDGQLT